MLLNSGKPVQNVLPENSVDTTVRYDDSVVALEIPDDPYRAQTILLPRMNDIFDNSWRRLFRMSSSDRFLVDQSLVAMFLKCLIPIIECRRGNTKVAASIGYVS